MDIKEQIKQKYLQFQAFQQQIEQNSQQLELFNQQLNDLEVSEDALKQLTKIPEDNEVLASIAPGIFIKTALKDNQKLMVNVGAEVTAEKTVPQVLEMLEIQKKEIKSSIAQLDTLLHLLTQQALKMYQELEKEENVQ